MGSHLRRSLTILEGGQGKWALWQFCPTTEESLKNALKIAKEHESKWEETEACRGLEKAYRKLGDNEAAQRYFLEALDIAPKQSYKKSESTIYLGLAHTYRGNGEYQNEIESYKMAVKLTQENGNVFEEMSVYMGLGLIFLN
jgi:tetratricopeptide (TPR) repeat protein